MKNKDRYSVTFETMNDLYNDGKLLMDLTHVISETEADRISEENVEVTGELLDIVPLTTIDVEGNSVTRHIFQIYVESIGRICAIFPEHQVKTAR